MPLTTVLAANDDDPPTKTYEFSFDVSDFGASPL